MAYADQYLEQEWAVAAKDKQDMSTVYSRIFHPKENVFCLCYNQTKVLLLISVFIAGFYT